MSQEVRENLSSYQFSRREEPRAVSSSTESPLPSPGESVRSRVFPSSSRARPRLKTRPHSSGEAARERARIHVVQESSDLTSIRSLEQLTKYSYVSAPAVEDDQDKHVLSSSDQRSAFGLDDQSMIRHPASDFAKTPSESASVKTKTSRPRWTRTRSGGVWYLKQRESPSLDGSSARSTKSTRPKSVESESLNLNIVPLKPPTGPQISQTSPVNHIIVEKPFEHEPDIDRAFSRLTHVSGHERRRRSSIDVKRLFSMPLIALRRSLREKASRAPSPSPAQTHTSSNLAKAASFASRRDEIGIALQRVSSLLEYHTSPKLKDRLSSWSHLPRSSTGSSNLDSRHSRTRTQVGTFYFERNKSLENIIDDKSSILNLQMGSTPQHSPTEQATYKVKRRSSATTEEFIKIDISIRGGTSYLPSEARRISTPPLPSDGPGGARRGFFFDYDAPHLGETCSEMHSNEHCTHLDDHKHTNSHLSANPGTVRSRSPTTTSRIQRSPSQKPATRPNLGDWIDTQLADLDAMTTDTDVNDPKEQDRHHCKHVCQIRLAELRKHQYEAQLDYNIPEHLPNSPLCPRNPKYWRVRYQKGSQFRGCWMHGFGEYEVVPGLYK